MLFMVYIGYRRFTYFLVLYVIEVGIIFIREYQTGIKAS